MMRICTECGAKHWQNDAKCVDCREKARKSSTSKGVNYDQKDQAEGRAERLAQFAGKRAKEIL